MKKRILILLAAVMVMLPLSGCKNQPTETEDTTAAEQETTPEGEVYFIDTLPRDQYDFKEITIATIDSNMVLSEPPEGADSVDVKKYERDFYLSERFNMEINYLEIKNGIDAEEAEHMLNLVMTGLSKIDIFIQQPDNLMKLAINGALTDLRTIQTLELENEWWSQNMNKNLTFNGSQYVAAGPVAEWYYGAVMAMAYNKKMATNYQMEDLYTVVENGDWTLEKMQQLCTEYGLTDKDQGKYAISFASGVGPYGLFAAAGGSFSTISEDGKIEVNLTNTRSTDILSKILQAFDPQQTVYGNITVTSEAFLSSKTMFYYTTVGYMEQFLPGSDIDYGIIPCPKFDKDQKDYISCAWPSSSYATAVPVNLTENRAEWAGLFLDAYCFLGLEMIKPVKYDSLLLYRVAQDEQSSAILDMIFADVYFDLNLVCNLGGSRSMIGTTLVQGMGGYAGKMLGIKSLIDNDIRTYSALVGKS